MVSDCLIVFTQYTPGKMEIQRRENRCLLRIMNADPEDEAEYSCECGNAKTTCKLGVTGKTIPPHERKNKNPNFTQIYKSNMHFA